VSQYQKGKTNLNFTEARDSKWQCHQLGRMQVCTSLRTDNHVSTPLLSFLQARCPSCRPTNSVKALKVSREGISRAQAQFQIKVGATDVAAVRPIPQEIDPRPRSRKRKVFSILVVISLIGTISGKSLKKFCLQVSHFKVKVHQIRFRLGTAPDLARGALVGPASEMTYIVSSGALSSTPSIHLWLAAWRSG